MRSLLTTVVLTAALALAAPAAALADDGALPSRNVDNGGGSSSGTSYAPTPPTEPSLAGSTATGECDGDVPWITYSVTLTDPDNLATGNTATLRMSSGANSVDIPLGELVDGSLSGRVLWPGASVDSGGNPTGWPGWAYRNGQWVEIDGNYAWTRGDITAVIIVNPEIEVALSYPPSTPECATSPSNTPTPTPTPAGLPETGVSAAVLPIGIAGGALALVGIALVVVRRRARH